MISMAIVSRCGSSIVGSRFLGLVGRHWWNGVFSVERSEHGIEFGWAATIEGRITDYWFEVDFSRAKCRHSAPLCKGACSASCPKAYGRDELRNSAYFTACV